MLNKSSLFILTTLLVFLGCTKNPTIPVPDSLAELKNLKVYNENEQPKFEFAYSFENRYGSSEGLLLGSMFNVHVDKNQNVYIGDYDATSIHVFDASGKFIHKIGRKGDGPGEFQSISNIFSTDDHLYVFDRPKQHINTFSLDTFEYVESINLNFDSNQRSDLKGRQVSKVYPIGNDEFLAEFYIPVTPSNYESDRSKKLYKVSKNGVIESDVILTLTTGKDLFDKEIPLLMSVPYSRSTLLTLSNNQIHRIWTENLAIESFEMDGTYSGAFYYSLEKRKFDKSQLINGFSHEMLKEAFIRASVPENWPTVNKFLVDDNGLFWVSRIVDTPKTNEWFVLSAQGELYARFEWPKVQDIQQIQDGFIYTLERNDDTGDENVMQYKYSLN